MCSCIFHEDRVEFLRNLELFLKANKKFSFALGKVLKNLRIIKDISKEEMIFYIKGSVSFLDQCESGKIMFPSNKVFKICKILKIDMFELYIIIVTFFPIKKYKDYLANFWYYKKERNLTFD